ncbi:SRPBCC family protein [Sanguibacter sp. A247]|uniref:SRPBCC family protein n=1 Tax=unclassified Sanguibacter TaxID=2645534 RepID=UPI003FD7CC85
MIRRPSLRAVATTGAVLTALSALPVLRTWAMQWGSTEAELDAELPGDELTPAAHHVVTRAVTIDAPAAAVWPWLVQLGRGRGGFYSYDVLENLAGLGIRSTDRIEARLQGLAVGDLVELAEGLALKVRTLEPGHALVLAGLPEDDNTGGPGATMPFRFTWAFVLDELPGDSTRLVVRERYEYLSSSAAFIVEPVTFASWLMTQQMLRGIRARALRYAR